MIRKYLAFLAFALFLLTGGTSWAKEKEEESDDSKVKYAVIQVVDENQKISYEVVPQEEAGNWMSNRQQKSQELRKEWKELPKEDQKKSPRPDIAKCKVDKNNLKGRKNAEKYAETALSKIPKNKRSGWEEEKKR